MISEILNETKVPKLLVRSENGGRLKLAHSEEVRGTRTTELWELQHKTELVAKRRATDFDQAKYYKS